MIIWNFKISELSENTWTHIIVTLDDSEKRVYINGLAILGNEYRGLK